MKLGTAGVIFLGVILAACGGKNDYPAAEVTEFMNGCLGNGGNPKYCSCVLDKVQRKFTFKEYDAMPLDKFIDSTKSITQECLK